MSDEYKRRAVKSASERAFELEEEARKLIESPKSDSLFSKDCITPSELTKANSSKSVQLLDFANLNAASSEFEKGIPM